MRLLVVDDDPAVLFLCRRFFSDHKVDVEEATEPEEAMRLIEQEPFDGVLSDFRLRSVKDGIDVLEFALRRQPESFRILMSGVADPSVVDEARRRARVDVFLEKPMTRPAFEDLLRRAVVDELRSRAGS